MTENWVDDVLTFWFNELEQPTGSPRVDATDTRIRTRFLDLYRRLAAQPGSALATSRREALAAVIVLDQFPRNLFRGDAQSFATDAHALAVTKAAIAAGFTQGLTVDESVLSLPALRAQREPGRPGPRGRSDQRAGQ